MRPTRTLTSRAIGSSIPMYAASLADLLALMPRRPLDVLVERASAGRVTALAKSIPASCVAQFGFERRLADGDSRVDFALSLTDHGLDWMHDANRWPAVCALSRFWRTALTPLPGNLWLEFDTSIHAHDELSPNVFFVFDSNCGEATIGPAVVKRMLHYALSTDREGLSAATGLFEHCFAACFRRIRKFHVGFMLGRNPAAFHFSALPFSCEEVPTFLQTIAWQTDERAVVAAITPYSGLCDELSIHLGITNNGLFTTGIELFCGGAPTERSTERESCWIALLERLVSGGLCNPSEQAALLSWPSSREFNAPLIERLIAAVNPTSEKFLDGTLHTCLHHIKLTIDEHQQISAKAYFGAILAPRFEAATHATRPRP